MSKSVEIGRHCGQCGATIRLPALPENVRQRISKACRAGSGPLAGVKLLKTISGLELADAKAVGFHITRKPGKCHHCDELIGENKSGTGTDCKKCGAINLDW